MKIACDNIDRMTTVSIRPQGMPRKKMAELYEAVRGDEAVSFEIASALLTSPDARIGIFTGAAVPDHLPNGENDGPIGSVVLARALSQLGYTVSVYTEIESLGPTRAFAKLIGCDIHIEELERDPGAQHTRLSAELDVAFTIEKAGVNEKGVQHSINGNSRAGTRAVIDEIITSMNAAGKITVGIGDGGNEIGFGKVFDLAREILPFGKKCACGCGGGIVTSTATTYLYPVAISNWGAYALAAALAIGAGRPEIALAPDEEKALLELAVELDCRDGGTGKAVFAVDGVSGEASMAFVRLLEELVTVTLKSFVRDF
jgi:hypothetical protein